jgi:hypothetical protein
MNFRANYLVENKNSAQFAIWQRRSKKFMDNAFSIFLTGIQSVRNPEIQSFPGKWGHNSEKRSYSGISLRITEWDSIPESHCHVVEHGRNCNYFHGQSSSISLLNDVSGIYPVQIVLAMIASAGCLVEITCRSWWSSRQTSQAVLDWDFVSCTSRGRMLLCF